MKFRKYGFSNWETEKQKIQITTTFDGQEVISWNPEMVAVVYEIGNICEKLNEETKECEVQSPLFSVDIVWVNEPLFYDTQMIWAKPMGLSSMGYSLDAEYTEAYCKIHPEYCKAKENGLQK
jgi:hypothetical protein